MHGTHTGGTVGALRNDKGKCYAVRPCAGLLQHLQLVMLLSCVYWQWMLGNKGAQTPAVACCSLCRGYGNSVRLPSRTAQRPLSFMPAACEQILAVSNCSETLPDPIRYNWRKRWHDCICSSPIHPHPIQQAQNPHPFLKPVPTGAFKGFVSLFDAAMTMAAVATAGVVGVSASGAQIYEYNSFGSSDTFSMTLVIDAWEDCIAELDERKAASGQKDLKMVGQLCWLQRWA